MKIEMIDTENILKYIKVNNENFEIAYNIQKQIWTDEPDYNNFQNKVKSIKEDNISWIVFYDKYPIGITGVFTEIFDSETIWLDWFGILPEYRNKGFGKKVLSDTINYCKKLGQYEYLRLDTTYWEGRPAIYLYDRVMTFKEKYTAEDIEVSNNWWIYTYSLKGNNEFWNNKFLGLSKYYNTLKNSK